MPQLNMVQAINRALDWEMEMDERVVLLGEDIGKNGGVFRVTEGLWEKHGDRRVMDTPLAESGIVGVAIGMAVFGLRPVAEIQFSGFLHPAFDQLISHAGRIRNRSRGRFSAPLVVRAPCGGGIRAPEHHSESYEAALIHTPGIKVVMPSSPYDAKGLLVSSIRDPDPVVFFEPTRIYRSIKQDVPEEPYSIPLGKAAKIKEGNDVTVISWGAMVRTAAEPAVEQAEKEGISCELIDMRTLSPYDGEAVLDSVKKTGRAVIVQEAPRTCGFAGEVAAFIQENAILNLEAPVKRVTGYDTVMPLYKLEGYYLPSTKRVLEAIRETARF